ncbi:glutathione S-transferase D7-like [Lasioglossum baleicum]|uniref:glutathione S-transferase D7-like n=1 Tax=Lasioglossum baleicum TaxID=434251 RepID=UPI003FCE9CE5
MPKVVLYSMEVSPPCRTVLLTAKLIGVPLEVRQCNLLEREQTSEAYTKVNPQQLIPAIDDDGFTLGDSHAIACYLVDKYAKNDALYPKDLQKRARVNWFLHMDSSDLFAAEKDAFKPLFLGLASTIPEEKMDKIKAAYTNFDRTLEGKKWLVGDFYTLADISCAITTAAVTAVLNLDDFPNVKAWFEGAEKEIPSFKEINDIGNKMLVEHIRSILG